jgi:putative ABC transport system substrate-binding protein
VNRRRRFLGALAGALSIPRFASAQPAGRTYRICWVSSGAPRSEAYNIAFVERLRELGFEEGRNLVIEFRSVGGDVKRLPEVTADLARLSCDALVPATSEAGLVAAKQASRDTPILMLASDFDPVEAGHVASFARPGGRITGVSQHQSQLPAKRLELLKELLPQATKVAVLADTGSMGQLPVVQDAAKSLRVDLLVHQFKQAPYDYEAAFAYFAQSQAHALLPLTSGLFVPARRKIPELALKHRLPGMFNNALWAEAGGLISYGVDFVAFYRRAAEQMAKILNGSKPSEMPVEQSTGIEMVVNLKTAAALGVTIPPLIRTRATRVIE